MNLFKKYFYVLLFSLSIFISLIFYQSSLDYYFFQDDFFEINISKADDLKQYLGFFKFRDDIVAYRPISLQNYFFISDLLFGLNPTGFRLITFILFLTSALLVAKTVTKITKSSKTGLLAASFYLTSSIHFMALSWIAAAYNIIGTFFFLLTSILFLNYLNSKKVFYYHLSIITFLICIGSFEFSVAWPAIFAFYHFFILKNNFTKTLKLFAPYTLVAIIYVVLRLALINVPDIDEYKIALNVNSIKALFWYLLWSFNIPEEFKKQIVDNILVFNGKFAKEFLPQIIIGFSGLLIIVFSSLYAFLKSLPKKEISLSHVGFFAFWFFAAIFPVLLIPNHTFVMYLTLAAIGAYASIAYVLVSQKKIFLTLLIFAIWIFTSGSTLKFYKHNFWMVNAQKNAQTFANNLKSLYLPKGQNSVVFYPLNSQIDTQPLMQSHAIQVLYNDPTLQIYYNKEALINDLGKIKNRHIYLLPH